MDYDMAHDIIGQSSIRPAAACGSPTVTNLKAASSLQRFLVSATLILRLLSLRRSRLFLSASAIDTNRGHLQRHIQMFTSYSLLPLPLSRCSDRHDAVSPVTTILQMCPDSSTLSPCPESRSVKSGLGPVLNSFFSPTRDIPNLKGRRAAGFCCFEHPISECLNLARVIFPTILAMIRMTKALFLFPMNRRCLTL
jgi:hypothetical protein